MTFLFIIILYIFPDGRHDTFDHNFRRTSSPWEFFYYYYLLFTFILCYMQFQYFQWWSKLTINNNTAKPQFNIILKRNYFNVWDNTESKYNKDKTLTMKSFPNFSSQYMLALKSCKKRIWDSNEFSEISFTAIVNFDFFNDLRQASRTTLSTCQMASIN